METKTAEAPVKPVEEKVFFEDYVYELTSVIKGEEVSLNEKSKIFLVINGIETNIPLQKLFIGEVDIDSEDFRGFSVLKMVKSNKLKIDANTTLDIAFIDKTTNKQFQIANIRRPNLGVIFDDDMEATPAIRLAFIDLLVGGGSVASEKAPTPEQVEAEVKAAAEAKRVEEEKKAELEKAELEAANKKLLGGGEWEAARQELLDKGYTEYKKYDYRFFRKDDLVELYALEPGDFFSVELSEEDIDDDKEVFSFEDAENNDWYVTYNKKSDKITIKESEE